MCYNLYEQWCKLVKDTWEVGGDQNIGEGKMEITDVSQLLEHVHGLPPEFYVYEEFIMVLSFENHYSTRTNRS